MDSWLIIQYVMVFGALSAPIWLMIWHTRIRKKTREPEATERKVKKDME